MRLIEGLGLFSGLPMHGNKQNQNVCIAVPCAFSVDVDVSPFPAMITAPSGATRQSIKHRICQRMLFLNNSAIGLEKAVKFFHFT